MASTPHVVARNGIIIPLLPHQGGILHRFNQPENKLVIARVSEDALTPDSAERMVSEATKENEVHVTPAARPDTASVAALAEANKANTVLQEQVAAMQEQMAKFMAAQANTVAPTAVMPEAIVPAPELPSAAAVAATAEVVDAKVTRAKKAKVEAPEPTVVM